MYGFEPEEEQVFALEDIAEAIQTHVTTSKKSCRRCGGTGRALFAAPCDWEHQEILAERYERGTLVRFRRGINLDTGELIGPFLRKPNLPRSHDENSEWCPACAGKGY
jgi:hypothetical protein